MGSLLHKANVAFAKFITGDVYRRLAKVGAWARAAGPSCHAARPALGTARARQCAEPRTPPNRARLARAPALAARVRVLSLGPRASAPTNRARPADPRRARPALRGPLH